MKIQIRRRAIFLSIPFFFVATSNAQTVHSLLKSGDNHYKKEDFSKAEESYRKADLQQRSPQTTYNLGNAIYRQGRHEEALQKFETTARDAKNADTKTRAFHNLGNAWFEQKQYDKSIEAYKNALRQNPNDAATKKNLALAQRQLQAQMKQQQQNKKQEQKQDEQQNQEQKQDQNQPSQPQNQEQQQEQQHQPAEQPQLSKEEAKKLLEIMSNEEQKVQRKLRKSQSAPSKSGKDW